jgi:hypothetical protein
MKTQTFNTTDLALAAALAALGIPFDDLPFVSTKSTKGEHFVFLFKAVSNCGKFHTSDMARAWESEAWHVENPEHPFAYIKCAFKNREALLDKVKSAAPLIVVPKNGKLAIVSADASPELQTSIFSKL